MPICRAGGSWQRGLQRTCIKIGTFVMVLTLFTTLFSIYGEGTIKAETPSYTEHMKPLLGGMAKASVKALEDSTKLEFKVPLKELMDEHASIKLKLPEVECLDDVKPVYGGIVSPREPGDAPIGIEPVQIKETEPGIAYLSLLNYWLTYEVQLSVWCGTTLRKVTRQLFTVGRGLVHDYGYIHVLETPAVFHVQIYTTYLRANNDGDFHITLCKVDNMTDCQSVTAYRTKRLTKTLLKTPKPDRYLLIIKTRFSKDSVVYDSRRVFFKIDNTPTPKEWFESFDERNKVAEHLNATVLHEEDMVEVGVHVDVNLCKNASGQKNLELHYAMDSGRKGVVFVNLKVYRAKYVIIPLHTIQPNDLIYIEGFLICNSGISIRLASKLDASVQTQKQPPKEYLVEDRSEKPNAMVFQLGKSGNKAKVTIHFPVVQCALKENPRFVGFGVVKASRRDAILYSFNPIEFDSPGEPVTIEDLSFWTTYSVFTHVLCGLSFSVLDRYAGEFYTGSGPLPDIEFVLVDVDKQKSSVMIQTARYNVTENVNFKLKLCPVTLGRKSEGCNEYSEYRAGPRTFIELETKPSTAYKLSVEPEIPGETPIKGQEVSLDFTTSPCGKACQDLFTDTSARPLRTNSPFRRVLEAIQGKRNLADIIVPAPNPCERLRPDVMSLEYLVDLKDRRGFATIDLFRLNMPVFTFTNFELDSLVYFSAEVTCRGSDTKRKYNGVISTNLDPNLSATGGKKPKGFGPTIVNTTDAENAQTTPQPDPPQHDEL